MSSSGRILEMTPLLPCRPAILSPTEITPLGGDVDLDHLLHAGGQLVAALQRVELAVLLVDAGTRAARQCRVVDLLGVCFCCSGLRMSRLSSLNVCGLLDDDLVVLVARPAACRRRVLQLLLVEHLARVSSTMAPELVGDLLVALGSRSPSAPCRTLLRSSSVRLSAAAEPLRVDDDAFDAGRHFEQSFFTSSPARPKIACSSFSSGVSSLLRLGRDLADQDVARAARRCRCGRCRSRRGCDSAFGRDVGDVAGELFLAELGLADLDLELLDVDRGVGVVLHQPLADDDRVLEVVAVPGHERDQHVAAQGQLALVRGGAVGDDLALLRPSGRA